jgi:hypothetical protein
VKIPHLLRKVFIEDGSRDLYQAPLYEMFVTEWIFKPLLDQVRSDLDQLLTDLNLWDSGSTSDGNFSLDEIYLSLNRLVNELQAVDTGINMFIQRTSPEGNRNTKKRSAAVKLWKACRKVVSGFPTR